MPIARTPIINDDGTCTTGTVLDNAWKQELYGQIDVYGGFWYDQVFNAANFFGGSGLVWTVAPGHITTNKAVLAANTLLWNVIIAGSSLSGVDGPILNLVIPYGLVALGSSLSLAKCYDGVGGWQYCDLNVNAGSSSVTIGKPDFSNFHVNNGLTYVYFKTWIDCFTA